MRRHPLLGHTPATNPALTVLLGCAIALGSCSDSRLDPSGLRQADKSAHADLDLADGPKPRHVGRPGPRPVKGATIPTPPYRLDIRVDPADLRLFPPKAALIAAIRPDFPAGLAGLLGSYGQSLHRLPALQWLGEQLLTKSLASPLGLRTDRAVLVALLAESGSFDVLKKRLEAQVRRADKPRVGPHMATALKPAGLPKTTLRIRIVAQVADEKKTRAAIGTLVARAQKTGVKGLHLTNAATATMAIRALAAKGVLATGFGPRLAHAWTLAGGRLLVDLLVPVSGPWSQKHAGSAFAKLLSLPPNTARPTPFERGLLLSSADVSLIIRGPALARTARWLGVAELLAALPMADPKLIPRLVQMGWRVANTTVAFQRSGTRPFDGCGLRFYLVGARPQLRVSWRLTAAGQGLLDSPTRAVAGADLARNNGLVERWLKPLAARVPKALPPAGVFAKPGLNKKLLEGGFFMWPLALAELWPRLLPVKAVRKTVIKALRLWIRPGRFVRRVNVGQRGKLLELVLEGKRARPAK